MYGNVAKEDLIFLSNSLSALSGDSADTSADIATQLVSHSQDMGLDVQMADEADIPQQAQAAIREKREYMDKSQFKPSELAVISDTMMRNLNTKKHETTQYILQTLSIFAIISATRSIKSLAANLLTKNVTII